jgi:hypothetical protein
MAFCIKQKNRIWFGLQTDQFHTFEVMDHNFGTLQRISRQRRELKSIDHLPIINLWWPTPSPHALAIVLEQWSIHASAGMTRSRAALPRRPRVTFYRHLCLYFILKKIIVGLNFEIRSTLDNKWPSVLSKKNVLDSLGRWTTISVLYDMFHSNEESWNLSITFQWSTYDGLHRVLMLLH